MAYNIFANQTGPIPLSELDSNFSQATQLVNLAATGTGQGANLVGIQRNDLAHAGGGTVAFWLVFTPINVVRDYGFDNTGSTDNTAKMAGLLLDVQTNSATRGRRLYFPPGTYRFDSTIAFSASSGGNHAISIEGDNSSCCVLDFSLAPAGSDGITFNSGSYIYLSHFSVHGAPRDGIVFGIGLTPGGSGLCSRIGVYDVQVNNAGRNGWNIINMSHGMFKGANATSCGSDGMFFSGFSSENSFDTCEWDSNAQVGCSIVQADHCTFTSCSAALNALHGFSVTNATSVSFLACESSVNGQNGWLFASGSSFDGAFSSTQLNIRGVSLVACSSSGNSTSSHGTYATFLNCVATGRPIGVSVSGGYAASSNASDKAIITSSSGGGVVRVSSDLFDDSQCTVDNVIGTPGDYRVLSRSGDFTVATLSALQSLPNNGTTTLALTTLGSNTMGATVVSNSIIVPRGVHIVRAHGSIQMSANASGFRSLEIVRNGVSIEGSGLNQAISLGASSMTMQATTPVFAVNAGDAISMQLFQNSGAAVNANNVPQTSLVLEALG